MNRLQRILCTAIGVSLIASAGACEQPWVRHTIDDSSDGADGVRLADANDDGLPDIATPWEEGGAIRVYLNPGPQEAKQPWPSVNVGSVGTPEDAVLVDVDGDGAMDVVSCSEGKTRTVWIHWGPRDGGAYLDPAAWRTEALPASLDRTAWMWCLPLQVDGKSGTDLVCGAKNKDAVVGWFESPPNPRDLSAWHWRPMSPAGWIMSLEAHDMDGDGDRDVVLTDRRGAHRGCRWLENPGVGERQRQPWASHIMGATDKEVMFLAPGSSERNAFDSVLAATADRELVMLSLHTTRSDVAQHDWREASIAIPATCGTGKGVAVGDIDMDGRNDFVFSCEHAEGKKGVMWISCGSDNEHEGPFTYHDVSGVEGIKFDVVRLHDVDADGDLDILTCEERTGLGVIWYENPTR